MVQAGRPPDHRGRGHAGDLRSCPGAVTRGPDPGRSGKMIFMPNGPRCLSSRWRLLRVAVRGGQGIRVRRARPARRTGGIAVASLSASRAWPALRRGPPIPAIPSANAPAPRPSSKRPAAEHVDGGGLLGEHGGRAQWQVGDVGEQVHMPGPGGQPGDQGERVGEAVVVGMVLDADQVQAAGVRDRGDPLGDGQAAGVGIDVESELHGLRHDRAPRLEFSHPRQNTLPARTRQRTEVLSQRRRRRYGRTAPSKVAAYQLVFMGIFSTFKPVCGASMM